MTPREGSTIWEDPRRAARAWRRRPSPARLARARAIAELLLKARDAARLGDLPSWPEPELDEVLRPFEDEQDEG